VAFLLVTFAAMISIEALYQIYQKFPLVQTDSRRVGSGELFFALKGEHFNGNLFAEQALEKGASYAIVDEQPASGFSSQRIILVKDVLETLQNLARHHREQFKIPFIAITGSNGKTTTKELLHAVLSSSFKTYTTEGNLNNHIGIPLTLLKVNADAEIAVIEMGANHQKEIEGYCRYCLPTHGIITNSGKAHLEGFGGIEGVRKGKGELYDFLRANQGTAFVMWDYEYLREMSRGIAEIVRYGTKDAALTGQLIESEPFLTVKITQGMDLPEIATSLVGAYNLPNVLASVAVGQYFKVPPEEIKQAIENYKPSNSRSQLIDFHSNKIILDAYNANPSSMKAAIENFAHIHTGKKVLLLGAMAELGTESLQEHQQIIDLIGQYPWDEVVLVGGDFLILDHPYRRFENSQQAKQWFQQQKFQDSYMLVKGSRSMQMEKLLDR
jgi:UDP-N-acetylmuramoyl-tripeptide--D-alanyl-D-alanine ligase